MNIKKKGLWTLVACALAALTIFTIMKGSGMTVADFLDAWGRADKRWLAVAFLCMLGFIGFEGMAVRSILKISGYPRRHRQGVLYGAAEVYFSAITPSATGGQPACALLMMRDGIPGIVTTAVLLLTLAMYALSILAIGGLCLLLKPSVLSVFGAPSRVLIAVGFALQVGLAAFFFLLVRSEKLLEGICRGALHLLARLHILHDEARRREKLDATMAEYARCVALLSGHRSMLLRSFLYNLLQRASQIAVTMLVFLAMGGQPRLAGSIFAMQSFVVIGSNCVPIPGAMGVADYLMLDGFNAFLPQDQGISMELLSRSVSFYSCVLLCGLTVLVTLYQMRKAARK